MKNVILFTIDTLRKDVLGCYGCEEGLTPFLDSIQDKCIRFTKAQAVGPYTQASFPGILTSSYLLDYERSQQLSSKRTLISEAVKKAGIATAAIHSNPYMCDFFGWNRDWDHFYDSLDDEVTDLSPYIKGDLINDKVDKWLSSHVTSQDYKPFFLWMHYMDVHEPYAPEKKYIEKIDPSIDMTDADYMKLFREVTLPRISSNTENVELCRKLYKAHVIEVDEYAKMFFDILKKNNILEDTVVIITADHGDEFGEHNGLSHDGKMYSELINVPFFIYDPTLEKGQTCDNLVSGLDISPTVLNLLGLDPEPNFKGRSVLPVEKYPDEGCFGEAIGKLSHKIKPTDEPVYYYQKNNMRITHRLENDCWEMYDLTADPKELNNIIDTSPSAEEMKNKLNQFINRKTQG